MKQILAVVQPYCAQAVLEAIATFGPQAVTVRESKGFRLRVGGNADDYGGVYLPKIEISLLADDDKVESIARGIAETARTGRLGDGKILLLPVVAEVDF